MKKTVHQFTPALSNILYTGKSKKSGMEMLEKATKAKKKKLNYKIPKTPKVSGTGWGH